MERVCFVMQIQPDRVQDYRVAHEAVWPTMLRAIARAGRRNYSLFLRDDGLLVGYYETEDREASDQALARDPETAAWEERARGFFVDQEHRPDQGVAALPEVFNLAEQLGRLDTAP